MIKAYLCCLLAASTVLAQEAPVPPQAPSTTTSPATLPVTGSVIQVAGREFRYTAKPDFIQLKDDAGKPLARFFHTTYMLDGTKPADRPITFVFNGGPGSSSVWLHLGIAGPKRVVINGNALPPPPPGRLEENADTWLTDTDLVFIDPIGTGFSRPEPGVDGKQFYSLEGDISSIAEFVRLYLVKNNRWASPKFLAGESYGTTRAAGLSSFLAQRHGIDVSGIILISSVLEFNTIRDTEGNDLPDVLFFPSYVATAYHHKKLAPEMLALPIEQVLQQAETFATSEYLPALAAGASLTADKRKDIVAKLARFTGLTADYIDRANLRVAPARFMKQILSADRKIVGRFDATITSPDPDPNAATPGFDPSYSAYLGAYTSSLAQYFRSELSVDNELKYNILTGLPWTYPEGEYVNTAASLATAMTQNPHLRVLVASGYQDLATPYFATEYTLGRLNLPDEARKRLSVKEYFGGHMMYHYPESRRKLSGDIRYFITTSAKP